MVSRASKKLGFEVSFHSLHHTCATEWLNNGIPIAKVQVWLGHTNISTTAIYLHFTDELDDGLKEKFGY